MRPYLKDGKLSLVLAKTERARLESVAEMCRVIASMSPIDAELKDASVLVLDATTVILMKTGSIASDTQQELPL